MEGVQAGSAWLIWLGLGVGIATLIFSAIGAGGVLLNLWRRRTNLKLSVETATWLPPGDRRRVLLRVKIKLQNWSDLANAVTSAELGFGPDFKRLLTPARVIGNHLDTNYLTLSVDGGGTNLLNPMELGAEPIIEFPIQMSPHSTMSGWLLFPLSPEGEPGNLRLMANVMKGTNQEIRFAIEDSQEAEKRE